MRKNPLQLSEAEREHLQGLVRQHNVSVKVCQRAKALLELDQGGRLAQAARIIGVDYNSVAAWRDTFKAEGLAATLRDRPRPGRPGRIEGGQRAQITALACSTPPVGHARWSRRLLADQAVELGFVEALSHNHAGKLLKKSPRSAPQEDVVHR